MIILQAYLAQFLCFYTGMGANNHKSTLVQIMAWCRQQAIIWTNVGQDTRCHMVPTHLNESSKYHYHLLQCSPIKPWPQHDTSGISGELSFRRVQFKCRVLEYCLLPTSGEYNSVSLQRIKRFEKCFSNKCFPWVAIMRWNICHY